jgi:hypothetical protein
MLDKFKSSRARLGLAHWGGFTRIPRFGANVFDPAISA